MKMCLSQRIPDEDQLQSEVEIKVQQRHGQAKPIIRRCTGQEARRKLARLYPRVTK